NNDGNGKMGFTAPSINGQVEVAVEALERASVSPETIAFVEAHGTGTALGDPIEVASLTQTFRNYTDGKQFCALGSVKGNIGHTAVASGVAGVIKTALALTPRMLPASLNFAAPNPKIDFASSPFFVNTGPRPLTANGTPPRALITSFGVGGTNACAILEAPAAPPHPAVRPSRNVALLSARSEAALAAAAAQLAAHLDRHPETDPAALAYTLQAGRRHFSHRRHVLFGDCADLIEKLREGRGGDHVAAGEAERTVAFAFPGQGNQF